MAHPTSAALNKTLEIYAADDEPKKI